MRCKPNIFIGLPGLASVERQLWYAVGGSRCLSELPQEELEMQELWLTCGGTNLQSQRWLDGVRGLCLLDLKARLCRKTKS